MTAGRHTNLTKLRVFYPFKNDTRLDFLKNLHCMMNLMVEINLSSWRCGNVMQKKQEWIEKHSKELRRGFEKMKSLTLKRWRLEN
jgi:hypothetical protein